MKSAEDINDESIKWRWKSLKLINHSLEKPASVCGRAFYPELEGLARLEHIRAPAADQAQTEPGCLEEGWLLGRAALQGAVVPQWGDNSRTAFHILSYFPRFAGVKLHDLPWKSQQQPVCWAGRCGRQWLKPCLLTTQRPPPTFPLTLRNCGMQWGLHASRVISPWTLTHETAPQVAFGCVEVRVISIWFFFQYWGLNPRTFPVLPLQVFLTCFLDFIFS